MKPFDYVVDLITSVVPIPKMPTAVRAVMPLLSNLMTSQMVLTDDVRATLQGQVLRSLRAAGLEGVDLK
jgi:hypothetical protein